MVMRNRHDGANAPQWWDDLPPGIKKRCANSSHLQTQNRFATDGQAQEQPDGLSSSPVRIARELSWFALIVLAIVFADLLFILLAVSFLYGRSLFTH
jgi:hypothetical protein